MNLPTPTATIARLNPHLFNQGGLRRVASDGAKDEAGLHDQIFDDCRARGWIAFHGSMAAATHRTLGEPDFIILASGGRVLLVECKTRAGKLSPAQLAVKIHAEKLGHTVHVIRSYDEFCELANQ